VLKWGIPASVLVFIAWGFLRAGAGAGLSMAGWWVVITGALSGLGAIAAFAHPLSILTAVVVAPLTTLHPLLAAGWISGLVEAMVRKPQVKDLEELPQDILSFSGFWRNRATRVLLVVALTNLGASLGTFAAIPFMAWAFKVAG
jgi:pheromone shutdown protein TraB